MASAAPLWAAAGATLASLAPVAGADARFALVTSGMAWPLAIARALRPGASARSRWVVALLALPWLGAIAAPRSTLALTWLSGGVLFLGVDALAHAARTSWRLARPLPARLALSAVGAAPGLYLWVAAGVVLFNTQLAIAPVKLAHQRPATDPGERAVTLHTDDAYALGATYTPGEDGAPGIVLTHGVADGRTRFLPWAHRLREDGYHVLRYDLRGHGTSEGAVVTYGQRERVDLRAAIAWLREAPGVDGSRIGLAAASMGGAVTLAALPDLAADPRSGVRCAVLLAPASFFPELVAQRVAFLGPLAPFVLNGSAVVARAMGQTPMTAWDPVARPPGLPVLVLHGTADRTIPPALSERLAARDAEVELQLLPGVGHDEIPAVVAAQRWDRVRGFLTDHLGEAPPLSSPR